MMYFISLDLENIIYKFINRIQSDLNKTNCTISRSLPKQEHVTLKYLGELDEYDVITIRERLRELVKKYTQFKLHTTKINTFPIKTHACIVWLGVNQTKELMNLQNNICELTKNIILKKTEVHEYIPHITIARVNYNYCERELQMFFESMNNIKEITFAVTEIKLKKSTMTPLGPKYEDIETFELNK
ncbi:MAG: RNA 2',3'-cyclic phosphodiesterase [Candidatus Aenigmarchaeota archaeon]|nr:RNA 2',3'-cyclic phosphodiesterase [Candidatus Aenigmarchaeota archaeon]